MAQAGAQGDIQKDVKDKLDSAFCLLKIIAIMAQADTQGEAPTDLERGLGNIIIQSLDADKFFKIIETVGKDEARVELEKLGESGMVWYNMLEGHFKDKASRES